MTITQETARQLNVIMDIFNKSDKEGIPTNVASDLKAEERIHKIASPKSFYLPNRKKISLKDVKNVRI